MIFLRTSPVSILTIDPTPRLSVVGAISTQLVNVKLGAGLSTRNPACGYISWECGGIFVHVVHCQISFTNFGVVGRMPDFMNDISQWATATVQYRSQMLASYCSALSNSFTNIVLRHTWIILVWHATDLGLFLVEAYNLSSLWFTYIFFTWYRVPYRLQIKHNSECKFVWSETLVFWMNCLM